MAVVLRAALLVTLAACGRFDFGLLSGPDDANALSSDAAPSIDAAPVGCVIEGAACDDLDICTTSSTCMSNVCVGPVHQPCSVAKFSDEYSDTQGAGGWFYGAWNLTDDAIPGYQPNSDFESFAFFPVDGAWHPTTFEQTGPNQTWAYIQWWGGHPGDRPKQRYPTRRWVSDVVGHANVIIDFGKSDISGGDGVGCIVYVDGVKQLDRVIEFDDNVGFVETLPVELAVGTTIDALITYRGDDGTDSTDLNVEVVSR